MPPTSTRKIGQEKNKKGKLSDKTPSFNGRVVQLPPEIIPVPRTVPELVSVKNTGDNLAVAQGRPQKLSKLLLNVTIQRSPGAVHVVISPESTVKDLITAALRQYQKEARRPVLPSSDGCGFQLHYSQFRPRMFGYGGKGNCIRIKKLLFVPKGARGCHCKKQCICYNVNCRLFKGS